MGESVSAFEFQMWKRRSNELSYMWGTHFKTAAQKSPRANYKGHLVADPVTGQLQPHYPRWKTLVKVAHSVHHDSPLPLCYLCVVFANVDQ